MDTPQESPPDHHLTAWHVFLIEIIRYYSDLRRVEVRDFVKLGTLPLEADAILLRKLVDGSLDGLSHLMAAELDFLEPRLRDLTVVEYKSPVDVLSRAAIDMARVYALLGKQRFQIEHDRQVSIILMYSATQRRLFEQLREDGLRFEEEEEGILRCDGSLVMYAVNLVKLGRRRPQSPINLVSARHAEYSHDRRIDPGALALLERIRYLIQQGKVRGMPVEQLPGFEEIVRDAETIRRRFLENLDPSERLAGLQPSERLAGLQPSERLAGLQPSEEEELLALLLKRRQQRG
jgi:hypothetical protein